jgi:hypothetical protein
MDSQRVLPAVDQEAVLVPAAAREVVAPIPESPRTMTTSMTGSITTTTRLPVTAAASGRRELLPRFSPPPGSCSCRHRGCAQGA